MVTWPSFEALAKGWSVSLIKSTPNHFTYQALTFTPSHSAFTQIAWARHQTVNDSPYAFEPTKLNKLASPQRAYET